MFSFPTIYQVFPESLRFAEANAEEVRPQQSDAETDDQTGGGLPVPEVTKIDWPETLMGDEYSTFRDQIETLLACRSIIECDLQSIRQELREVAKNMNRELVTHIKEMRPLDYLAGKRFISRLAE